ncbi:hypothetical protein BDM02DRAFT_3268747 [Thelephora ganbajun]|uniref:Uncharacterized protein n=1 Tax=Thelephora ganbajun TaxID=370292 RepID=A0ACB6ZIK4_THEGA|nr:hypothetical protein BDM02DRAFT_3268747 [Thelephora ganbajun]
MDTVKVVTTTTVIHIHIPIRTKTIPSASATCQDLVLKRDYESFLTSKFFPNNSQDGFFALKAFYIELATVQDHITQPIIGQMRMQFWKDAVKSIGKGTPPNHPVALALYDTARRADLPAYHLKRIIDAREAELHSPTHMTLDSLLAHAESTSSTLNYLFLRVLSLHTSDLLSHAASHMGVAQAITTLLRALPYHAAQRRMVIPAEITAKHGVNQETVFRSIGGGRVDAEENGKKLEEAVFEFATVANDHVLTAREMFKEGGKVPVRAMPLFLSMIPVINFLQRLEAANFNAFEPTLQRKDWKLPWRIWSGYHKRTF